MRPATTGRAAGLLALLGALLLTSACGSAVVPAAEAARPPELGAHNDTSTPFNLASVPALARHPFDGGDLRLGRVLDRSRGSVTHAVSYRSGGLRVTGVLQRPDRTAARVPLVVLAHGWTDPARYRTGGMLGRERAALVEAGFAAFQVDYRNHAGSDREGPGTVARPRGYPEDLINAVRAARLARLPGIDTSRVGLFGRSMGGGVVLTALAAVPDLADVAVLSSPVSSSAADTYGRWVVARPALRERVVAAYGTPASHPARWERFSARSRLHRVDVPVLVHHGTADEVCPPGWSRDTVAALRAGGGDATLVEYPGEGHRYVEAWPVMMRRTTDFFAAHLG